MLDHKDIKGYEGIYQIFTDGTIHSYERVIHYTGVKGGKGSRIVKGRVMKSKINKYGYVCIKLRNGTIQRDHLIHRLVADAFIKNNEHKRTVNHKDSNKQNNNISNLEWATDSEQHLHRYEHNPTKRDSKGRWLACSIK